MANISVYNLKGEKAGETKLSPEVFGLEEIREDIVHQAVESIRSRQRDTIASTKTRGEVRGGGRKPWRQKGTGRARAGSIRSPIWVGGGVTFGPSADRNFEKSINKKTKRLALRMALTDKVNEGRLFVVEKLELPEAKTKTADQTLRRLAGKLKGLTDRVLLITAEKKDQLIRATSNLPDVEVRTGSSLNIIDILKAESILLEKDALEIIEKTYRE